MANELLTRVVAILDKVKSKAQINRDIKELEKTISGLKVVLNLNKTESKKALNAEIENLSQQVDYLKLKVKINKKLARTQLSHDVSDLENTTKTLGLKAKIKQGKVQQEVRQEIGKGQSAADKNPIDINVRINEAQSQKLIGQVENFAKKNSKLFKNSDYTQSYNSILESAFSASTTKEMQEVRTRLGAFKEQLDVVGLSGLSFGDKMQKGLGKAFSLFSWTGAAMMAYNTLNSQTQEILAIDKAMTDLSKVSDEINSRNSFPEYIEKSIKKAKELAVETKELIQSTAEFSRTGFDLKNSEGLSEIANVMANVADMDIKDSTKSLVSTLKAFKEIDNLGESQFVERAQAVSDKLNEVGNKFSSSSEDLAVALMEGSSALAVANNDINQTIGLIVAGNEVTQDASEVGNALKVVSMRLRNIEVDGEVAADSVAKLQQKILTLTGGEVNIMADNDTFKSTYDILLEISDVWDDLTDKSRAGLLETIAGKHRGTVVSGLLDNMDSAVAAYETSVGAAGSATKEFSRYQESAEAAITRFKQSALDLSSNVIGGDLIKNLANAGSSTLTFVDDLHLLELALSAVIGIGVAKFTLDIGRTFSDVSKSVSTFTSAMSMLNNTKTTGFNKGNYKELGLATKDLTDKQLALFMSSKLLGDTEKKNIIINQGLTGEKKAAKLATFGLSEATDTATGSTIAATTATFSFKGAILGVGAAIKSAFLANPIGWVIVGITTAVGVATAAMDGYNQKIQDTIDKANDLADAYKEQQKTYKGNSDIIAETSKDYETLSKGVGQHGKNISLTTEEYSRYNQIVNQIADMFPTMVQGYTIEGNAILTMKGNVEELTKALQDQKDAYNRNMLVQGQDVFAGAKNEITEYQKKLEDVQKAIKMMDGSFNSLTDNDFGGKWEQSNFFDKYGLDTSVTDLSFNGNGTNSSIKLDVKDSEERNRRQQIYNTLLAEEQQILNGIASSKVKTNSVIQAFLELQPIFAGLNEDVQQSVSQIASSLDIQDFGYDASKMQAYIDSAILRPIHENKDNIQTNLTEVLSIQDAFDKGNISPQEFIEKMSPLKDAIENVVNPNDKYEIEIGTGNALEQINNLKNAFTNQDFGLDSAQIDGLFENFDLDKLYEIKESLYKVFEDNKDASTYVDFLNKYMENDDVLNFLGELDDKLLSNSISVSDYNQALSENATQLGLTGNELAWFLELYSKSPIAMGNFNDAIDDSQKKLEILQEAISKVGSGELATDPNAIVDLVQDFPELAQYADLAAGSMDGLRSALEDVRNSEINSMLNQMKDNLLDNSEKAKELKEQLELGNVSDTAYSMQIDELDKGNSILEMTISLYQKLTDEINTFAQVESQLDNIQSAYQTLSSAIEEYTSEGYLSIDAMQSILALGDEYIGYLFNEQGQLQLNEAGFIALANAKLDELEATALRNAVTSVQSLNNEAAAAEYLKGKNQELTSATKDLTVATLEKIAAEKLAEGGDIAEATSQIMTTFNQYKSVIDTTRSSLGSYTGAVMGAGSATKSAANAAKKAADDMKQAISSAQSDINNLLNMTMSMLKQKYNDQIDDIRDIMEADQESYEAQKDRIERLKDSAKKRYDADKKALEAEAKAREKQYDADKKALEDIADAKEKEREDAKKAAEDELDAFKKQIDSQKEILRLKEEEHDYQRDLADKQKGVSKIESELAALQFDDSATARKRKLELEEELAEQRADLEEYQHDHSIELQEEALDKLLSDFEETQQKKIDSIQAEMDKNKELYDEKQQQLEDEYQRWQERHEVEEEALQASYDREMERYDNKLKRIEDNYNATRKALEREIKSIQETSLKESNIRKEAMDLMQNHAEELKNQLLAWNAEYGDNLSTTVTTAWNAAYAALDRFGDCGMDVRGILDSLASEMDRVERSTDSAADAMDRLVRSIKERNAVEAKSVDKGSGSSNSSKNSGKAPVKKYKIGGYVNRKADDHEIADFFGKLAKNEVPIIAHEKEFVVNEKQQQIVADTLKNSSENSSRNSLSIIADYINSSSLDTDFRNFASSQMSDYIPASVMQNMNPLSNYVRIDSSPTVPNITIKTEILGNADAKVMDEWWGKNKNNIQETITSHVFRTTNRLGVYGTGRNAKHR